MGVRCDVLPWVSDTAALAVAGCEIVAPRHVYRKVLKKKGLA
jgi:hypothetical protein